MSTAETLVPETPYIPGTLIRYAIDSTTLGAFKQCPRYYQYTIIEGWRPKGENIHLRFGIEYHAALQDYDISRAAGIPHDDAVHDTVRELMHRLHDYPAVEPWMKPSLRVKTKHNLLACVVDYLDTKAKNDIAETVILDGGQAAVEVSFRFELDWGPDLGVKSDEAQPYVLCGHLDRIVTYHGDTFVMDRKTATGGLTDHYFSNFDPNNQMTLYTLAGKILFDTPIKGVIVDAVKVGEKPEFERAITYRTPDRIDEWVHDLRFWLAKMEDYAAEGYWPQNDTACGMYGGCRFREICSKSPQVREKFLNAEFERGEPWNPLKVR